MSAGGLINTLVWAILVIVIIIIIFLVAERLIAHLITAPLIYTDKETINQYNNESRMFHPLSTSSTMTITTSLYLT